MTYVEPTSPTKQRILVVDDLRDVCAMTGGILSDADYEVASANDGVSALALLEREDFDLVLMDLDMPGIDGIATATAMHCHENGAIRIAALTSSTANDARERSRLSGMQGFIERPIAPGDLLCEVAALLQQPPAYALPDPWNRSMFKDLVRRLGMIRMQQHMAQFDVQLAGLRNALEEPPNEPTLDRLTHQMISLAGMLGFLELSDACRPIMVGEDHCDTGAIARCIDRAQARLSHYGALFGTWRRALN